MNIVRCLLFGIVVGTAAILTPLMPAVPQQEHDTRDGADPEAYKPSMESVLWAWATRDPAASLTAIFTGLLALSTIALWRQTRKAAEAARIAAEHIPTVERAWIFAAPEFDAGRAGIAPHRLVIKNHGKTPGFVKEVCAEMRSTEPAGQPNYASSPEPVQMILACGEARPLGDQSAIAMNPEFCVGYVKYADIFGITYVSRFAYRVVQADRLIEMAGPREWNGHEKLKS